MLGLAVGVHQALDKQRQAQPSPIQHRHRRRDQAVVILKILFDFRLSLFLGVPRVAFDVAGYEDYENQGCQDPERSIQVRILRVLGLKISVEGYQAAADALPY